MYKMVLYDVFNFNPRSREGSDLQSHKYDCCMTDFNPRSREGSDSIY